MRGQISVIDIFSPVWLAFHSSAGLKKTADVPLWRSDVQPRGPLEIPVRLSKRLKGILKRWMAASLKITVVSVSAKLPEGFKAF